jgi:hypothetical protein
LNNASLRSHPRSAASALRFCESGGIQYGATGYIALYRFDIQRDQVRVLALRHQREIGYLP